jgi:hypothetical protein
MPGAPTGPPYGPPGSPPEPIEPFRESHEPLYRPGDTARQPEDQPVRMPERTGFRAYPRPADFNLPPEKFYEYLSVILADQDWRDRATLYVYRVWPVIDRTKAGGTTTNIAKLFGSDVISSEDDILHRWGSGSYHFKLRDGEAKKIVCMSTVKGLRDLENHPPILDLDDLDMDDPENKGYISWLKLKGIFKPEGERPSREDEEMNAEAIRPLTETIANLSEKLAYRHEMDERDEEEERKLEREAERRRDASPDAASKVIDMMATSMTKARETGEKIIDKAIDRADAMTRQQNDPTAALTMLQQLAITLKSIMPDQAPVAAPVAPAPAPAAPAAPAIDISALTLKFTEKMHEFESVQSQRMVDMLTNRILQLEKQAEVRPNPTPAPIPSAAPSSASQAGPKSLIDQLNEFSRIKETVRDLLDMNGPSEEPNPRPEKVSGIASYLPLIVQGVSVLGASVANSLYNLAVAKSGQGAPLRPEIPAAPNPEGQTSTLPVTETGATPAPEGSQAMNPYHSFLAAIEKPLMSHLEDESRTGADFADWLIDGYGRTAYDGIAEAGKKSLTGVIQTYPPIWNKVAAIPQKFDVFLEEFFSRDALREEEENQRQLRKKQREEAKKAKVVDATAIPMPPATPPAAPPAASPVQ